MGEDGRGDEAGAPESAANYVRGGGPPTPSHEESFGVRQARAKAEEGRLIEWAAGAGKLGGKIPVPEDRGGEHLVSYDPESNRYLKSTRPEANLGYGLALTDSGLGATAAEYLDRLALTNRYFGDDLRVERVVRQSGRAVIVTSQPQIDGPPATPGQIIGRLLEGVFALVAPGTFYQEADSVLVFDLYPKNVKFSAGKVLPIDPVFQRVTPEFVEFIRANYLRLPDYQNAEARAWDAAV